MSEYVLNEQEYNKILESCPDEISIATMYIVAISPVLAFLFIAGIWCISDGSVWLGIALMIAAIAGLWGTLKNLKNKKEEKARLESGDVKAYITNITDKKMVKSNGRRGSSSVTYYLYFTMSNEFPNFFGRGQKRDERRNSCNDNEYRFAQIGDELIFVRFGEGKFQNRMFLRKLLYERGNNNERIYAD